MERNIEKLPLSPDQGITRRSPISRNTNRKIFQHARLFHHIKIMALKSIITDQCGVSIWKPKPVYPYEGAAGGASGPDEKTRRPAFFPSANHADLDGLQGTLRDDKEVKNDWTHLPGVLVVLRSKPSVNLPHAATCPTNVQTTKSWKSSLS